MIDGTLDSSSQGDAMSTGQGYDTIAERYRDSKRFPFHRAIERRHPLSDH